jgi:DMSO/TMAO reductase YedYZ molybdopterin-dependent catalytic subunit
VPGFPAPGQPDEVTPVPSFYVVSKNTQDPAIDARLWRLQIGGLVQHPFSLTFDDLLALPRRHEFVTLECVSNPVGGSLMSNAYWSGTPLAALLERASPAGGAGRVVMRASDGHEESVPLDVALRPENLIAYAMNGELLTRLHGHPARSLLPGLYGFKQVKWLSSIELASDSYRGYWPQRGWNDDAVIRTTARVDLARREAGQVLAAGMALAGRRSISSVEVRLVDGANGQSAAGWLPAELHQPPLSPMTWVQWRARLPLPATSGGELLVEARAVDGDGYPQESAPNGPFPSGASGYHRLQVKG